MNLEIMQLRAKLAERKTRYRELEMDASNLIIAIRNYINPYEDDVTRLKTTESLQAAKQLDNVVIELKGLKIKIDDLEKALRG